MKFFIYISNIMIPLVVFIIVGYGVLNKKKVYDDFVRGAAEGLKTVIGIMPTLVALMVSVGVLRTSGFLDLCAEVIGKATEKFGLPAPVVPVILIKMLSSSAATGLALDIFKEYGPDSRIGWIVSILLSCTETIFYTMSVYFMTAKVSKSRWTLSGALIATGVGIVMSVVMAGFM